MSFFLCCVQKQPDNNNEIHSEKFEKEKSMRNGGPSDVLFDKHLELQKNKDYHTAQKSQSSYAKFGNDYSVKAGGETKGDTESYNKRSESTKKIESGYIEVTKSLSKLLKLENSQNQNITNNLKIDGERKYIKIALLNNDQLKAIVCYNNALKCNEDQNTKKSLNKITHSKDSFRITESKNSHPIETDNFTFNLGNTNVKNSKLENKAEQKIVKHDITNKKKNEIKYTNKVNPVNKGDELNNNKSKVVNNLKTSNKESENEEVIFTQSTKNKLTAEKGKPKKEITEKSKLSNLNDQKNTKEANNTKKANNANNDKNMNLNLVKEKKVKEEKKNKLKQTKNKVKIKDRYNEESQSSGSEESNDHIDEDENEDESDDDDDDSSESFEKDYKRHHTKKIKVKRIKQKEKNKTSKNNNPIIVYKEKKHSIHDQMNQLCYSCTGVNSNIHPNNVIKLCTCCSGNNNNINHNHNHNISMNMPMTSQSFNLCPNSKGSLNPLYYNCPTISSMSCCNNLNNNFNSTQFNNNHNPNYNQGQFGFNNVSTPLSNIQSISNINPQNSMCLITPNSKPGLSNNFFSPSSNNHGLVNSLGNLNISSHKELQQNAINQIFSIEFNEKGLSAKFSYDALIEAIKNKSIQLTGSHNAGCDKCRQIYSFIILNRLNEVKLFKCNYCSHHINPTSIVYYTNKFVQKISG